MNASEDTTAGYTVIAYWEEYDCGSDRRRRCRFTEDHYDTVDEAVNASIRAQVDDADTVRIFRGNDVEDEISDWGTVCNRVRIGRETKAQEELVRRNREITEKNAQLKATQEKYELIQLQNLLAKYPNAKPTGAP